MKQNSRTLEHSCSTFCVFKENMTLKKVLSISLHKDVSNVNVKIIGDFQLNMLKIFFHSENSVS